MPRRLDAMGKLYESLEAWVDQARTDPPGADAETTDALIEAWDEAREVGAV